MGMVRSVIRVIIIVSECHGLECQSIIIVMVRTCSFGVSGVGVMLRIVMVRSVIISSVIIIMVLASKYHGGQSIMGGGV